MKSSGRPPRKSLTRRSLLRRFGLTAAAGAGAGSLLRANPALAELTAEHAAHGSDAAVAEANGAP
ncbi:MAG: hypothetical protein ACERKT_06330, partial [Acidobacteriota bacterium]